MTIDSRIPDLINNSFFAMNRWFAKMLACGLLFHPEERAENIVDVVSGNALFSADECAELNLILDTMFAKHGEKVCDVAYKYLCKSISIEKI